LRREYIKTLLRKKNDEGMDVYMAAYRSKGTRRGKKRPEKRQSRVVQATTHYHLTGAVCK